MLFYDTRDAVVDFGERGGPIIPWISGMIFLMWLLVFERLWFFSFSFQQLTQQLSREWSARRERESWHAKNIRIDLIAQGQAAIRRNISLIEACFVLCPLLGLMGTVTGMIDVFQILAITGGGDPKPMAGGVSRATLPTLTGMVGALSGYAALVVVRSQANRSEIQLESRLATSDH